MLITNKSNTFYHKGRSFLRDLSNLISSQISDSIKNEAIEHSFNVTKGRCLYCGAKMYTHDETTGDDTLIKDCNSDHLIPVSSLGLFVPGNIAITCIKCNKEKGVLSPVEYFKLRKKNNQVTFVDTKDEFIEELAKVQEEYFEKWPLIARLGTRIMKDEIDEVSLETIIACLSVSPISGQIILPIPSSKEINTDPIKAESDTSPVATRPGVPLEIPALIDETLTMIRELLVEANLEKANKLSETRSVLIFLYKQDNTVFDSNTTLTKEEVLRYYNHGIKQMSLGINAKKKVRNLVTLFGVLRNNNNLILNNSYIIALNNQTKISDKRLNEAKMQLELTNN